jgi:putative solute:sodium symporter small subunit
VTREKLDPRAYWRANLRVITLLLAIWLVVGILLSIVFVDALNRFSLGGYPLGFWFAQQGSIFVFILLILVYARWMERIERGGGRSRKDRG